MQHRRLPVGVSGNTRNILRFRIKSMDPCLLPRSRVATVTSRAQRGSVVRQCRWTRTQDLLAVRRPCQMSQPLLLNPGFHWELNQTLVWVLIQRLHKPGLERSERRRRLMEEVEESSPLHLPRRFPGFLPSHISAPLPLPIRKSG